MLLAARNPFGRFRGMGGLSTFQRFTYAYLRDLHAVGHATASQVEPLLLAAPATECDAVVLDSAASEHAAYVGVAPMAVPCGSAGTSPHSPSSSDAEMPAAALKIRVLGSSR